MDQNLNVANINPNVIKLLRGPVTTFYKKIMANDLVGNTVEIIGYVDDFDPNYEFIDYFDIRKASRKYIQHEKDWYLSLDRSIISHEGIENNKVWQHVASKDNKKEVNSQYGWIVFSPENGNLNKSQYDNCLEQLIKNPNTRQAGMIYLRPSIWNEYNENGKNDFICTIAVWCEIRNNRLDYIVQMRSNDFFTGYVNDWAWHYYVYHKLLKDLQDNGINVKSGRIRWNANSFHVYDYNFEQLIDIYNRFKLEEKKKYYYIYKITNLVDGKSYIGKHYGSMYDKYFGSSTILHKKNIKFEEQNSNFIKSILEIGTKNNIDDLERKWIKKENTLYPNGYNISLGGTGRDYITNHPRRSEIIKKISESIKKRNKEHPEIMQRLHELNRGVNNGRWKGGISYPKEKILSMHEVIFNDKELSKLFKSMWNSSFITINEIENFFGIYKSGKLAKRLNLGPKNKFICGYINTVTHEIYNNLLELKKQFTNVTVNNLPKFIKVITIGDIYDINISNSLKAKYEKNIRKTDGYKKNKEIKSNNIRKSKVYADVSGKNNPRYYELDPIIYEKAKEDYYKNDLYFKEIQKKYHISIGKFQKKLKEEGLEFKTKNYRRKNK